MGSSDCTCVSQFPEAWSNLAAAYLRKKEKCVYVLGGIAEQAQYSCIVICTHSLCVCRVRAFHAYREALKCSFENWKIWENYLLVHTLLN